MKHSLKLIILFILLTSTIFSQNKKIVKVIDSNLYMLEDSTLIKLAGVDVPSRNQTDEYLKELATDIYFYAYDNFLNRPLEIIYAGEDEQYPGTKLVLINKFFLLSKMNYNSYFLERGFGKFIKNTDSINVSIYISAEANAKENFSGIWKYSDLNSFGILDRSNSPDGYLTEFVASIEQPFKYDRNLGRILLEIPLGFGIGTLTSIPFFYAGTIQNDRSETSINAVFVYVAYASYTFGNSLGVYLVAKGGNKDLSLAYTFLTSAVFGAASVGIFNTLKETDRGLEIFVPVFAPLFGALIYANAIGYPQEQYDGPTGLDFSKKLSTHHQFIKTQSVNFELLKINF